MYLQNNFNGMLQREPQAWNATQTSSQYRPNSYINQGSAPSFINNVPAFQSFANSLGGISNQLSSGNSNGATFQYNPPNSTFGFNPLITPYTAFSERPNVEGQAFNSQPFGQAINFTNIGTPINNMNNPISYPTVNATYSNNGMYTGNGGFTNLTQSGINQQGMNGQMGHSGMQGMQGEAPMSMVDEDGNMIPGHDFYSHVSNLYPKLLAEGQHQYGGYAWISDNTIVGRNPITGMQPVIDQAIKDIMNVAANRNLPRVDLESKIAKRLTQLNDWSVLTPETQEKLQELSGIDFSKMSKEEREKSINHLLHSPLPFGYIEQALRPDTRIDLAYTHTLDLDKTLAEDLGNGVYKITLISNNNNGSHTGHNLGSFNLQLAPGISSEQAISFANNMIINTNNNNELYLSEVARKQLNQYIINA